MTKQALLKIILSFMLLSLSLSEDIYSELQELTDSSGNVYDIDSSADSQIIVTTNHVGSTFRIYRKKGISFELSQSF